jgi:hypothetical protein
MGHSDGGSSIGNSESYVYKALVTGISLHMGPKGDLEGGGLSPGTLRDRKKKDLRVEHLSLWGSERETWMEGGFLFWEL